MCPTILLFQSFAGFPQDFLEARKYVLRPRQGNLRAKQRIFPQDVRASSIADVRVLLVFRISLPMTCSSFFQLEAFFVFIQILHSCVLPRPPCLFRRSQGNRQGRTGIICSTECVIVINSDQWNKNHKGYAAFGLLRSGLRPLSRLASSGNARRFCAPIQVVFIDRF